MTEFRDWSLAACIKKAAMYTEQGYDVFQKFSCEKCGQRNTSTESNSFPAVGKCECGHETDLQKRGCNYVIKRRVK